MASAAGVTAAMAPATAAAMLRECGRRRPDEK
jgi:hypothetical protein